MQIKGKFSADVTAFSVRRNNTHDGKEGFATFDIGVDKDEAIKKLGQDFHDLAFATMRVIEAEGENDTDRIGFLQDTIKPGKSVVFPRHKIELDGHNIDEQPEMLGIKTVDGAQRVIATVRVPIDTGKKQLVSHLVHNVGNSLKIEFEPQQGVLPLAPRKGKDSAEDAEVEAAE